MAIHLKEGFADYIDKLQLTRNSRNNYKQYVRWIEKFGSGDIDLDAMRSEDDISHFVDSIAKEYNNHHNSGKKFHIHRINDAKSIVRHYLKFLQN
jgi:hypothetical protein